MTISQLNLHHFRNINKAKLLLSSKFNFIVGDNGSGKTSLLEAIYMLGHGRSFRHNQSNRIIQHQHNEFILFSQVVTSQSQTRNIGISKSRNNDNKIKIDNDEGYRLTDLAKLLPIQLITPEGFDLLTGGPKYRRAYVDWGCFHHYPEFFNLWNNLRRLFKQRNALLKQCQSYNQLLAWDKEIVPIATKIAQIRKAYTRHIFPEIIRTTAEFLPEYSLQSHYYQGWDANLDYADVLYKQYDRDKALSYTTLGPHKADIRLQVEHIPVEDLFSRGQLKLLMCSMRLAQGEYYSSLTKQPCIYLLDDFASELDKTKRQLLAVKLKSLNSQVFISAVTQQQISHMIDENSKIFYIKSGIISD